MVCISLLQDAIKIARIRNFCSLELPNYFLRNFTMEDTSQNRSIFSGYVKYNYITRIVRRNFIIFIFLFMSTLFLFSLSYIEKKVIIMMRNRSKIKEEVQKNEIKNESPSRYI